MLRRHTRNPIPYARCCLFGLIALSSVGCFRVPKACETSSACGECSPKASCLEDQGDAGVDSDPDGMVVPTEDARIPATLDPMTPTDAALADAAVQSTDAGRRRDASTVDTGEPPPPGDLRITPADLDFGVLQPSDQPVQRVVTIFNASAGPIRIHRVGLAEDSAPAFAEARMLSEEKVIEGYGYRQIVVSYSPQPSGGQSQVGAVVISSDDPERPEVAIPLVGACPECIADPGCNATHPHRLFPVNAYPNPCYDGRPTTGPGATSWFFYAGCANWVEFETTAGREIEISTGGDGCACPGCVLWHINYDLLEDLGAGLEPLRHVGVDDSRQCPNGVEPSDLTRYSPRTSRVRMIANYTQTGGGFYFGVCSQ